MDFCGEYFHEAAGMLALIANVILTGSSELSGRDVIVLSDEFHENIVNDAPISFMCCSTPSNLSKAKFFVQVNCAMIATQHLKLEHGNAETRLYERYECCIRSKAQAPTSIFFGKIGSNHQAFSLMVCGAKITYVNAFMDDDKKNRPLFAKPFCGIIYAEYSIVMQTAATFIANG